MSGSISKKVSKEKRSEKAQTTANEPAPQPVRTAIHDEFRRLQRSADNWAAGRLLKLRIHKDRPDRDDAPPDVHEVLRSPGQPLDPDIRELMESRFGYNLRGVRIHTDAKAAKSAKAIDAHAYTTGPDIVFNQGYYLPQTGKGIELLAHELAHVLQHHHQPPGPASEEFSQPGDAWESSAQTDLAGWKQDTPSGPAPRFLLETDPRHARGHAGEQQMGAGSYRAENGWLFVQGPSGADGHGGTTSRADGVAYNIRTGELHILDNKSLARRGNVGSATAIDPQRNLLQNINRIISHVEGMSQNQLPNRQRILRRLRQARAAIRGGRSVRTVPRVRLIVTNAGGRSRGVTRRLSRLGVEFIDIQQPAPRPGTPEAARALRDGHPEARRPGTARPTLGRGPRGDVGGSGQESPTQQQAGRHSSQPGARAGTQGRITSRGQRTAFLTPGRATYPQAPRPSSTMRGTTRSRPRYRGAGMERFMRPGVGAAAVAVPAAVEAWQDLTIRHAVATRILAKWSLVERIRRDHPAHVILVEVSLQEWDRPDPAGMVARGVNYVLIGHGPDRQSAKASVAGLTKMPPRGWVEVGPFEGWVESTDSLEEAKEYLESEEICFIATACYGTSMGAEVCLLRTFRDRVIRKHRLGCAFIESYYRLSPPIARFLRKNVLARMLVRQLVLSLIVATLRLSERCWRQKYPMGGDVVD